MDQQIADVRAFNRFYTRQIGLLDEHYSDSPLSLPEARVLYEIDSRGHTTAGELWRSLGMDRGYLSRILRKLGDAGLTAMTPNPADRRSNNLALTTDGDLIADKLGRTSNEAVATLLQPLDAEQRRQLTDAMRTIRAILGDDAVEADGAVILRPHRIGELGWLIHRQGLLYNQQYGWNGDFEALIAQLYNAFHFAPETPPRQLWVAEHRGAIAGSIFCMPSDGIEASAQLRMLYVEPEARGRGIGQMLVDQCVSFAREAGYERLRLWTHSIQEAARRCYARAGFGIVEEWDHDSFGKQLHAEIWERRFQ